MYTSIQQTDRDHQSIVSHRLVGFIHDKPVWDEVKVVRFGRLIDRSILSPPPFSSLPILSFPLYLPRTKTKKDEQSRGVVIRIRYGYGTELIWTR